MVKILKTKPDKKLEYVYTVEEKAWSVPSNIWQDLLYKCE